MPYPAECTATSLLHGQYNYVQDVQESRAAACLSDNYQPVPVVNR